MDVPLESVAHRLENITLIMTDIVNRLKEFMENEARSCSMDFGCITPLYVYRMWGGNVGIDEIESALKQIRLYDYR